jgi:hypothetical protein
MPFLGFGKEWLDPDLPLVDGLLVGLRDLVTPHFLQVVRVERAMDDAATVARGALGLDMARVADGRIGPVDDGSLRRLDPLTHQHVVRWTAVPVLIRVVGERVSAEQRGPVLKVG